MPPPALHGSQPCCLCCSHAAANALTPPTTLAQAPSIVNSTYQAIIAIETDGEYYALFNDATRAFDYAALLIGCALGWRVVVA